MPSNPVVRVRAADESAAALLREGVERIEAELEVTAAFPPAVEEAAAAAAADPRLPALDRTDIPFVTIDPESARDLDQALHLERHDGGYTVHYAIADLAAFITPGDPVDVEAHKRGQTLYGADSKVPLHPKVISEDAGSLLPDQVRPALLWTITLSAEGEETDARVERALVRSRAKLSYDQAQHMIDSGTAEEPLALLKEVGALRLALEADRGGVSLPLPEQEIVVEGDRWDLEFRSLLPVEEWNAQISLLTGFAAADMMVYGRVGLLRTLPEPDPRDVRHLHRTARALGIEWPAEMLYPDFIRSLDPQNPRHAAMIVASTQLLRGSGYVAFDGEVPAEPQHSALAAEYAHVTAPLRRLGDRYAGEVCLALSADQPVPDWVHAALPDLPKELSETGRLAARYERMILDLVEAGLLHKRVGEVFEAVVTEVEDDDQRRGTVTIQEPAVEAPVRSSRPLPLGEHVTVKLAEADVLARRVSFALE